jgi:hypothetical protein
MTRVNAVKAAAASGARIRGVHLTFAAPTVIELLADHVDFVYLDGEHGCFDWRDIETACITAERCDRTVIARVPDQSSATIVHFLDRGVQGIVAPHVETVAEARAVVAAVQCRDLGVSDDRERCRDRGGGRTRLRRRLRLSEFRVDGPGPVARPSRRSGASRGQAGGRRGARASAPPASACGRIS